MWMITTSPFIKLGEWLFALKYFVTKNEKKLKIMKFQKQKLTMIIPVLISQYNISILKLVSYTHIF